MKKPGCSTRTILCSALATKISLGITNVLRFVKIHRSLTKWSVAPESSAKIIWFVGWTPVHLSCHLRGVSNLPALFAQESGPDNFSSQMLNVNKLTFQQFRGDGDINSATREDSEQAPTGWGYRRPARVAIQRLKNNKAVGPDGLPAHLFKVRSDELVKSMHQLVCRIWLEESMPSEWTLSALYPDIKRDMRQLSSYKSSPYCI